MDELKKCPFCGGTAYLEKPKSDYGRYLVTCRFGCGQTKQGDTEEQARNSWNTRPTEDKKTMDEAVLALGNELLELDDEEFNRVLEENKTGKFSGIVIDSLNKPEEV